MSDLQSAADINIMSTDVTPTPAESKPMTTTGENIGPVDNDLSTKLPSLWIPEVGNWTCSWLNTAKEKTKTTLGTMKKDISEFSDTLQQGANTLASATVKQAQVIQHLIASSSDENNSTNIQRFEDQNVETSSFTDEKETHTGGFIGGGLNWVKQMVDTVQKFATEDTTQDEDEFTEEIRLGPGGRQTLLDQFTLLQMQNDTRTFLQDPQQNIDLYQDWLSDFKILEYNGEINMLLGYNPRLREIYAELVPSHVDNNIFWNRYFFKVHLMELDKQIAMGTTTKLNMDKKTGIDMHSPAVSNGGRDDWSMCSSEVTTEAEEIEAIYEIPANSDNSREEAPTPRPEHQKTKKCILDKEVDDWEECTDEPDTGC